VRHSFLSKTVKLGFYTPHLAIKAICDAHPPHFQLRPSRASVRPTEQKSGYEFETYISLIGFQTYAADIEVANRGSDSAIAMGDNGQSCLYSEMHVIVMHIVFDFMHSSRLVGKTSPVAGRGSIGMKVCDKDVSTRHANAG
jgi:hypothetical protein